MACDDWEPDPKDPQRRRCRYYLASPTRGFCALATHFTCSEWDRRYAAARGLPIGPAARETPVGSPPPGAGASADHPPTPTPPEPTSSRNGSGNFSTAPPIHDLIAEPLHLPPSAKARQDANGAAASSYVLKPTVPEPPKLGGGKRKPIDLAGAIVDGPEPTWTVPADVAGLEAAGVEAEFSLEGLAVHPPKPVVLVPARTGRTDRHEIAYRDLTALRWCVEAFPGARVTALVFKDPPAKVPDVMREGDVVHRDLRPGKVRLRIAGKMVETNASEVPRGCTVDREGWVRVPQGFVNNCALRDGEEELLCQICDGNCPDRHWY